MSGDQAIQTVQGFCDYYPEDDAVRQRFFRAFALHAEDQGFVPWTAATVESLATVERCHGAEGELFGQTMPVTTHVDAGPSTGPSTDPSTGPSTGPTAGADARGPNAVLRPDLTVGLVRMLRGKQNAAGGMREPLPMRLHTTGTCWRREHTGRGRAKEHVQCNVDVVGEPTIAAELELLTCMFATLAEMRLPAPEIRVFVSSRALLNAFMACLGIPAPKHGPVLRLLDKKTKMPQARWAKELEALLADSSAAASAASSAVLMSGLTEGLSAQEPLDLVPLAEESGAATPEKLKTLAAAAGHVDVFLRTAATACTFGASLSFDASLARGLDYYTGLVFEGYHKSDMDKALFGGGRYDGIFERLGSPVPVPCAGLGCGDLRLLQLLKKLKRADPLLPQRRPSADVVVAAPSADHIGAATVVAQALRNKGLLCTFACGTDGNCKRVVRQALRRHVPKVVVVHTVELADVFVYSAGFGRKSVYNRTEGVDPVKTLYDW
jgi:histidyl-tRNA synthetase